VEVLSREAGLVVTRGVYTVNFTDGRTSARSQVVTTVWTRRPEGWRMVHLHESWPR
jgi:ketosteroid isomerase-like protein